MSVAKRSAISYSDKLKFSSNHLRWELRIPSNSASFLTALARERGELVYITVGPQDGPSVLFGTFVLFLLTPALPMYLSHADL